MAVEDQIRDTARNMRLQAQRNRNQADEMHKSEEDLRRVAGQLDSQATILERQATESNDAESRAQQTMDKFKSQNR